MCRTISSIYADNVRQPHLKTTEILVDTLFYILVGKWELRSALIVDMMLISINRNEKSLRGTINIPLSSLIVSYVALTCLPRFNFAEH